MTECNCPLKADEDRGMSACNAEHPESDFLCSKPEGHNGPHAACNVVEHPVATWEQEGSA